MLFIVITIQTTLTLKAVNHINGKILLNLYWEHYKPKTSEKRRRKHQEDPIEGTGIIIPSDPNALLERLDLLLASQEAGHTGVVNELVSICDELKRQKVINADEYKKINSIIKK